MTKDAGVENWQRTLKASSDNEGMNLWAKVMKSAEDQGYVDPQGAVEQAIKDARNEMPDPVNAPYEPEQIALAIEIKLDKHAQAPQL